MKILITKSSFGFDKGKEYPATIQSGGYFASNGFLSKFIPASEAVVSKE